MADLSWATMKATMSKAKKRENATDWSKDTMSLATLMETKKLVIAKDNLTKETPKEVMCSVRTRASMLVTTRA